MASILFSGNTAITRYYNKRDLRENTSVSALELVGGCMLIVHGKGSTVIKCVLLVKVVSEIACR